MINDTHNILFKNIPHYFPEFADFTEIDVIGFGWFQGWNDGEGDPHGVTEYEQNLVNLIKDVRIACV